MIGTGAGGAPVAKELAEGGMRVAMLEEGERFTTDDFTARPRDMTARLYRDAGQTATARQRPDRAAARDAAVGGTTLINSGTCFRTPPPVLEMWRERFGLEELSAAELDPFFRRVERELNVVQVPPELAGRNAEVVKRGADALGWSGDYVWRNVRGCVGSGRVQLRLPDGREAARRASRTCRARGTPAPRPSPAARAPDRDARRARARRRGGHHRRRPAARGVRHRGGRLRCDPHAAVPAPPGPRARVGRAVPQPRDPPGHGGAALFDEQIDMARGVPQSYFVDEFADEGIMLEGAAGPPDYAAMSLPFSGERHRDLMLRYQHMSQFGLMVSDVSRGSVRERAGRVEIRYDLCREDVATFKRAVELLCELYAAAGAEVLIPPIEGWPSCAPDEQPRLGAICGRAT